MEKHFMLDIESTGIDWHTEDLLQVGILEVTWQGRQWEPGRSLEFIQHSPRKPESEFAKQHMTDMYRRCNEAQSMPVEIARDRIINFFHECGAGGVENTYLMGWNASNFDIPFLVHKGYLQSSRYVTGEDGKDRQVGDFHYRVYEIGGAVSLVQNVLNVRDRAGVITAARASFPVPADKMPAGKEHDALYDCYSQLALLNGLIALARARVE